MSESINSVDRRTNYMKNQERNLLLVVVYVAKNYLRVEMCTIPDLS